MPGASRVLRTSDEEAFFADESLTILGAKVAQTAPRNTFMWQYQSPVHNH